MLVGVLGWAEWGVAVLWWWGVWGQEWVLSSAPPPPPQGPVTTQHPLRGGGGHTTNSAYGNGAGGWDQALRRCRSPGWRRPLTSRGSRRATKSAVLTHCLQRLQAMIFIAAAAAECPPTRREDKRWCGPYLPPGLRGMTGGRHSFSFGWGRRIPLHRRPLLS